MTSEEELAFLRARLDEAERAALAAKGDEPGTWIARVDGEVFAMESGRWVAGAAEPEATHIACHDPKSALREVETWRRLLLEYSTVGLDAKYKGTERETGYKIGLSVALRAKAYEFREHPDYAAAALHDDRTAGGGLNGMPECELPPEAARAVEAAEDRLRCAFTGFAEQIAAIKASLAELPDDAAPEQVEAALQAGKEWAAADG